MIKRNNLTDTGTFALMIHILRSVKMLIWEWGHYLLAHKAVFEVFTLAGLSTEKEQKYRDIPLFFCPLFLKVVIYCK